LADYRFVTTWKLRAPIGRVWDAIYESKQWPGWWRGVIRVDELRPGGPDGVGAIQRYTWRSKLPYSLVFDMEVTRVAALSLLEGRASGELEGTGVWELNEADGITTVRYTWAVRTTRPWMNFLAPLMRPAFAWNHDYVMGNGAVGLAKLLGAELISK
jgi:uncharacterized protein YndB with AHSA1/START domain